MNYSGNPLRVSSILYTTDLPDYPETAIDGVAYVINVQHLREQEVDILCQSVCKVKK